MNSAALLAEAASFLEALCASEVERRVLFLRALRQSETLRRVN